MELENLMPSSRILNGKVTYNVPIDSTYLGMPAQSHTFYRIISTKVIVNQQIREEDILILTSALCPRMPVVATASSDGCILYFVEPLQLIYTISAKSNK